MTTLMKYSTTFDEGTLMKDVTAYMKNVTDFMKDVQT